MDYTFPSDQDRAENQQLNEACEYIEHLLEQQPSAGVVPEPFRELINALCDAVINDDDLPPTKYALRCGRLINEVRAMLTAAPTGHRSLALSDEKILEIASNPMVTPCSPWWLKDDVMAGDAQNAAIAFARAVLKAAAPTPEAEPVFWWDGDLSDLDDCVRKDQSAYHTIPLYTRPQPAGPEWKERLTEIYRRESTRLGHELNNLRSEYHNRTAELETEIEDLQEELQRVRQQPTAAPTPEAGQSGGVPEKVLDDAMWEVTEAAMDILHRRAAPHVWEAQVLDACRKVIDKYRDAHPHNGEQGGEIPACAECGSTDLGWQVHSAVNSGAPDGRLRASEVSSLFVLGCNHCSETIKTLTADDVAERMNPQPPKSKEGES